MRVKIAVVKRLIVLILLPSVLGLLAAFCDDLRQSHGIFCRWHFLEFMHGHMDFMVAFRQSSKGSE